MEAAEDLGLRIPDDLALAGFDDIAPSAHMRPPLTTVRQPFYEMGQQAISLLLSLLEASRTRIPPSLQSLRPLTVRSSASSARSHPHPAAIDPYRPSFQYRQDPSSELAGKPGTIYQEGGLRAPILLDCVTGYASARSELIDKSPIWRILTDGISASSHHGRAIGRCRAV